MDTHTQAGPILHPWGKIHMPLILLVSPARAVNVRVGNRIVSPFITYLKWYMVKSKLFSCHFSNYKIFLKREKIIQIFAILVSSTQSKHNWRFIMIRANFHPTSLWTLIIHNHANTVADMKCNAWRVNHLETTLKHVHMPLKGISTRIKHLRLLDT